MDQVEIARLSVTDTRRQIAVATASAYLAIIAQKRQVDVILTAIETARGQLDYNTRRREGGVGSRLNELRSSAGAVVGRSAARSVAASTCCARRKRSACCSRRMARSTCSGEPAFEIPQEVPESRVAAESSRRPACSPRERDANERIVNDSRKDWWPAASVTFGPQLLTPSGIFQPSRTWALSVQLSQPIFEGGQRRGVRRQREAIFEASKLSLEQVQIEARSEVRIARAAVESRERALAAARQAAQTRQ